MEILQGNKAIEMGKNALKASTKDAESKIYKEIRELVDEKGKKKC